MIKYDPALMEKARWIIERGGGKPKQPEVDRSLYLELPLPPPGWEPKKPEPKQEGYQT